jgi:hypothetical protein
MNTRTKYTFNRQRNNQNGEIANLNKPSDFISRTYENNQNDNGSVHSSYKYRKSNNPSVNGDNNQNNQNYQTFKNKIIKIIKLFKIKITKIIKIKI